MTVEKRLGPDYLLHEEIAQDAWSTTRRATSRNGGPDVAALIVRPEFAAVEQVREIFAREEPALRDLHHESMIAVRDLVTDDGVLALILDLVDSPTLGQEAGRLSAADAAFLAARIGDALAVAHANGVLHLGLEPGNVHRTPSTVKISGFGVPALLREAGVPVPTSDYTAPELSGTVLPTAAADAYALGALTAGAVTGVRPPDADLETLPPQLQALLRKLLSADPRKRPSARSAAAQFRAIAAELTTADAESAPPAPEPELSAVVPAAPAPAQAAADPETPVTADPAPAASSAPTTSSALAAEPGSAAASDAMPAANPEVAPASSPAPGSVAGDEESPAPGSASASTVGQAPGQEDLAATDPEPADDPVPVPPTAPLQASGPAREPVAGTPTSVAETPTSVAGPVPRRQTAAAWPDVPDPVDDEGTSAGYGWVEEEPATAGAGPVLSIGTEPRPRVTWNRRRTLISSAVVVVLAAVAFLAVELRARDEPGAAPPTIVPRAGSPAPEVTSAPAPETATAAGPAPIATEKLVWPKRSTYAAHLPNKAGTLYVAIRDGQGIAYMCDGKRIEAWFKGPATDGSVNLSGKSGATLTGTYSGSEVSGKVSVQGRTYEYDVPAVYKPSGLYRASTKVRNADVKGGWIVLSDGSQVGVLTIGDAPQPAPTLNTVTRSASVDGTSVPATEIDVETGGGFS